MKSFVMISLMLSISNLTSAQTQFWQQTNGPNTGGVFCLAKDSAGFVFAGSNNGLYRSSDQGLTWRKLDLIASYVLALAVNKSDVLYACSLDGVSLSTDHGSTWSAIDSGLTNLNVNCIAPDHDGNLLVGTRGGGVFFLQHGTTTWVQRNAGLPNLYITCAMANTSGCTVVGTDNSGLFRSTDGGLSWNASADGLTNPWTNALASDESGTFFVATQGGVYRSTDDAVTWVQTNNGLTNTGVWGLHAYSIGQVLAATISGTVFRSTDSGNAWVCMFDEVTNTGRAFAITPQGQLLYATDDGLYRTADDGSTWSQVGLPRTCITAMLAQQSGWLFANASGYGLSRSSNSGYSWNKYDYFFVRCFAATPSGIVFAGNAEGVFRSTNNGDTWTLLSDQFDGVVMSLLIDSSGMIYAGVTMLVPPSGAGGLYRSTNGGFNWIRIAFAGLSVGPIGINHSGHLFAAEWAGLLHRSTDGGKTWQQLPDLDYVTSLAFTTSGSVYAGTRCGLFFSSDNGDTWSQAGLSGSSIQSLFVSPNDDVYCSTENDGVFVRRETDTTFTSLNSGLTSHGVLSLVMDEAGYLYAGSFDSGVFRSANPITGVRETKRTDPLQFTLHQNYPNPFNPSTTIRYELRHASRVSLKVYNTLGQEVATLVNETKPAGVYTVEFDARLPGGQAGSLASGVYFYRLVAGSFAETKRLVLIR